MSDEKEAEAARLPIIATPDMDDDRPTITATAIATTTTTTTATNSSSLNLELRPSNAPASQGLGVRSGSLRQRGVAFTTPPSSSSSTITTTTATTTSTLNNKSATADAFSPSSSHAFVRALRSSGEVDIDQSALPRFNARVFVREFLYHLFQPLAVLVVACTEGRVGLLNRHFLSPSPVCLLGWVMWSAPVVSLALFLTVDAPTASEVEVACLVIFTVLRFAVVGVKYAYFSREHMRRRREVVISREENNRTLVVVGWMAPDDTLLATQLALTQRMIGVKLADLVLTFAADPLQDDSSTFAPTARRLSVASTIVRKTASIKVGDNSVLSVHDEYDEEKASAVRRDEDDKNLVANNRGDNDNGDEHSDVDGSDDDSSGDDDSDDDLSEAAKRRRLLAAVRQRAEGLESVRARLASIQSASINAAQTALTAAGGATNGDNNNSNAHRPHQNHSQHSSTAQEQQEARSDEAMTKQDLESCPIQKANELLKRWTESEVEQGAVPVLLLAAELLAEAASSTSITVCRSKRHSRRATKSRRASAPDTSSISTPAASSSNDGVGLFGVLAGLIGFIGGIAPSIARAATGSAMFGGSNAERALIVITFLGNAIVLWSSTSFLFVAFVDFKRRLFLMHQLSAMLSARYRDLQLAAMRGMPTMDLVQRGAANIDAWFALRRVFLRFGGGFFQRLQAYTSLFILCEVGIVVILVLGAITGSGDSTRPARLAGLAMVLFSFTVVFAVLGLVANVARKINIQNGEQRNLLLFKLAELQMLAAVELDPTLVLHARRSQSLSLRKTQRLLCQLEEMRQGVEATIAMIETTHLALKVDDDSHPLRIGGLRANVAVLRAIASLGAAGISAALSTFYGGA